LWQPEHRTGLFPLEPPSSSPSLTSSIIPHLLNQTSLPLLVLLSDHHHDFTFLTLLGLEF
jgi:hypothetical protein